MGDVCDRDKYGIGPSARIHTAAPSYPIGGSSPALATEPEAPNIGFMRDIGEVVTAHLDTLRLTRLEEALQSLEPEMTLPLLQTLLAIARSPGMSVNELADRMGSPQQSASRYVAILSGRYQSPASASTWLSKPLLRFAIPEDDPRRRALFLTDLGAEKVNLFLSSIY